MLLYLLLWCETSDEEDKGRGRPLQSLAFGTSAPLSFPFLRPPVHYPCVFP